MCRWLAYSGSPIALQELVFKPRHSLIDQSLSAHSCETTTNGDGFGVGWYDRLETPALYKHTQPAWNDENLRDLCTHAHSPMFLAHIRASTGTAVQRSNCHPFRYGRWMLVHNGLIRDFFRLKRELAFGVQEGLFSHIGGTTDSELMFFLALSFGLEDDVAGGVARMVGFVEQVGRSKGVEHPVQMSLGITDGRRLYAFRYSSERSSRSLYHSRSIAELRALVPAEFRERMDEFSEDARAVVSEPLNELSEGWVEVPESCFLTVEEGGGVVCEEFQPEAP